MPGVDGASAGSDQSGPSPTAMKDGPPAPKPAAIPKPEPEPASSVTVELDDFGLPIRKYQAAETERGDTDSEAVTDIAKTVDGNKAAHKNDSSDRSDAVRKSPEGKRTAAAAGTQPSGETNDGAESGSDTNFSDAVSHNSSEAPDVPSRIPGNASLGDVVAEQKAAGITPGEIRLSDTKAKDAKPQTEHGPDEAPTKVQDQAVSEAKKTQPSITELKQESGVVNGTDTIGLSEYSHQQLTSLEPEKREDDDGGWQVMPAYAPYDIYDDNNKLIAREYNEGDDETYGYAGLGGAGKGYTKVLVDDDAESATSMDENTQYLFKEAGGSTSMMDDDDAQRDAVSQLQATKELLTEGQRIAYVGLTRLELSAMVSETESLKTTSSKTKKQVALAAENMKMWSQKMMIRLYTHMDISPDEQIMIEQLSSHGVMPQDLTPVLMANARVRNPMAARTEARTSLSNSSSSRPSSVVSSQAEQAAEPPPPYSADDDAELRASVRTPSQMPTTQRIDIDIRWTVLCDLFLVLIADSIYDARSRFLLERVAKDLEISWLDICRFEKKVTDALEMQQNAERENWNEEEHMENRRKLALKRRYVMMGLATVGGGLVIGLSAGLLAPVIGAGLAAGFTAIGVGGTSGFLAGAGGAAIITSGAAASGGIIGVRAANRRTGAVKTFEYRPLHNNKRVNLIVTVSGWMTGKVDDVRLPFSTVDPVMGDIYSVLWEPEMLTSMGDTINILATEALTQGLQQLLGNTILVTLMAGLQLPVVLTKLSYLIDNPWAVSLDRATMAGLILADSLIDRNLGTRPVTLVGYSLGSRVIFSCLQELAKKGAFGLVQNVYLFGSPVVVKHDEYARARTVVSGRFVNGYNRNDWILGYLFRLTNGGIRRVAGLAPIDNIPGVENMDASEFVVGHMDYRTAMPRLLRECGWLVESDEFTEIEDADPDNHQERQRELINEIEEARRELEKEGKGNKGGFGFFRKKKATQKEEWEVYEETAKGGKGGKTEDKEGNNHGVLFDVDAIRDELAKEKESKNSNVDEELLQVREIKSTLPPIKLDLGSSPASPASPGRPLPARTSWNSLRETRSADPTPSGRSSNEDKLSSYEYCASSRGPPSSRARTPTFPSSKSEGSPYHHQYHYGYGGSSNNGIDDHGDKIQMTFGTGFDDDDAKPLSSSSAAPGIANSVVTTTGSARPEIKSAQTVPNITLADPWADDDDPDFGKEKEISMTFA
ncbi:Transmembrane and coiled-coil domain-containing protein 4 [Madurella mycetomatis]|uniref:Transmembrane and coiled-coil domain-containing protein 4 n=1 Tax=Madurella mycetomatis TaxID=100816 RepID=A0A175W7I6_9PEZI|nr:Transmembrane and coiled-coil domain-containing protein 4 [Madurella mycetomatis]